MLDLKLSTRKSLKDLSLIQVLLRVLTLSNCLMLAAGFRPDFSGVSSLNEKLRPYREIWINIHNMKIKAISNSASTSQSEDRLIRSITIENAVVSLENILGDIDDEDLVIKKISDINIDIREYELGTKSDIKLVRDIFRMKIPNLTPTSTSSNIDDELLHSAFTEKILDMIGDVQREERERRRSSEGSSSGSSSGLIPGPGPFLNATVSSVVSKALTQRDYNINSSRCYIELHIGGASGGFDDDKDDVSLQQLIQASQSGTAVVVPVILGIIRMKPLTSAVSTDASRMRNEEMWGANSIIQPNENVEEDEEVVLDRPLELWDTSYTRTSGRQPRRDAYDALSNITYDASRIRHEQVWAKGIKSEVYEEEEEEGGTNTLWASRTSGQTRSSHDARKRGLLDRKIRQEKLNRGTSSSSIVDIDAEVPVVDNPLARIYPHGYIKPPKTNQGSVLNTVWGDTRDEDNSTSDSSSDSGPNNDSHNGIRVRNRHRSLLLKEEGSSDSKGSKGSSKGSKTNLFGKYSNTSSTASPHNLEASSSSDTEILDERSPSELFIEEEGSATSSRDESLSASDSAGTTGNHSTAKSSSVKSKSSAAKSSSCSSTLSSGRTLHTISSLRVHDGGNVIGRVTREEDDSEEDYQFEGIEKHRAEIRMKTERSHSAKGNSGARKEASKASTSTMVSTPIAAPPSHHHHHSSLGGRPPIAKSKSSTSIAKIGTIIGKSASPCNSSTAVGGSSGTRSVSKTSSTNPSPPSAPSSEGGNSKKGGFVIGNPNKMQL